MEPTVTRKFLALAAALLAAPALFASAAEACISCEYTPEVVKGSQTSDAPAYRAHSYERTYVERDRAPAKKRIVRSEPVVKQQVDTAEAEPVAKRAKSENSSVASVAVTPVTEQAKVDTKVDAKTARTENSSISVASTDEAAPAKTPVAATTKEASAKPIDCKKFFPSVGITLSVPCE
jgi:transposase-like protein